MRTLTGRVHFRKIFLSSPGYVRCKHIILYTQQSFNKYDNIIHIVLSTVSGL